ncbi:MAG: DUF2189 domain-containing protein [Gallionellaceae bacterium]|jgi:uncharacterized membrane protein
MSNEPDNNSSKAAEDMPFVAPCRTLELHAPFRWLRLGWRDLTRAPHLSLIYGLALMLLSLLISLFTWRYGTVALYIGLASGFMFVGPVLSVGLYSISRQLEEGRKPVLGYCIREGQHHLRELLVLGLILMVVLLVWARAATMMNVFMPMQANPGWQQMVPFFVIGSMVGAVFAGVVFAASAFSLPMIMDRKADAITAVITSANAVLRNKKPMLLWAGIIVLTVMLGFATFLIGFLILLPIIGHATWHAYKETIDASAWEKNSPAEEG